MTTFGDTYADIYDALYHDKDYDLESAFVDGLLKKRAKGAMNKILDLGCGTGRHDLALARRGYAVHGVDMSPQMLARARARAAELPPSVESLLSFDVGDIRDVDLKCTFDCVISLFHVMSYQTTDADLTSALATARRHLRPDGLLLFDFWHGPAVLADGPSRREKRTRKGNLEIVRRSDAVWDKPRDIVQVGYDVEITDTVSGRTESINEKHVVRYLFRDRLAPLLSGCGFEVVEQGEWLTGLPPSDNAFSVYIAARAQ